MMKMKTVFQVIFVFLFVIAIEAVFFLNRKIPKEPAKCSEISARVNDNALKWLADRRKLSACENDVAQLKKIVQFKGQELAQRMDLAKQQAQLQAVLAQQKTVLNAQENESREEAAKLKEAVYVPPAANVVPSVSSGGGNDEGIKDKIIIAQLNRNITDLNNKVSSVEKMSDDLRKNNLELAADNNKLQHLNSVLNADVAKLKARSLKLERKAKEFLQRALGKERLEKENAQLNKVVSLLTKEHVVLNNQNDDLKNKIKEMLAGEVNNYIEAGDVYIQYNLYDKAIEEYNKASQVDPNNAEVELKLGFLYKRVQDEPKEAVYHFKRYLLLMPHAKNRKEVQYMIKMLSNNSDSDWSNN